MFIQYQEHKMKHREFLWIRRRPPFHITMLADRAWLNWIYIAIHRMMWWMGVYVHPIVLNLGQWMKTRVQTDNIFTWLVLYYVDYLFLSDSVQVYFIFLIPFYHFHNGQRTFWLNLIKFMQNNSTKIIREVKKRMSHVFCQCSTVSEIILPVEKWVLNKINKCSLC